MIYLSDLGIKQAYLTNFYGGHGGDFFITLFAKACTDFYGLHIDPMEELEHRLQPELNMPGNNIGGKLIHMQSADHVDKTINDDLDRIHSHPKKETRVYGNMIHFATHYPQESKIDVVDYVLNNVDVPCKYIRLIPSNWTSYLWILHHYHVSAEYESFIEQVIPHLEDDINKHDADYNIDHIDLFINNRHRLRKLCDDIVYPNKIDDGLYDYIINFYEHKLEKFNIWVENLKGTDEFAHHKRQYYEMINPLLERIKIE